MGSNTLQIEAQQQSAIAERATLEGQLAEATSEVQAFKSQADQMAGRAQEKGVVCFVHSQAFPGLPPWRELL